MKRGLPPVVDSSSRLLVLGSLPSDASIRAQQYYADPRNQFWPLLFAVFREEPSSGYGDRMAFLGSHSIALWDVLQSGDRRGSSDAKIRNPVPNDIRAFLESHPAIAVVALNGRTAEACFFQHVARSLDIDFRRVVYIPSSSGMPGKSVLPLDAKIERWREALAGR